MSNILDTLIDYFFIPLRALQKQKDVTDSNFEINQKKQPVE